MHRVVTNYIKDSFAELRKVTWPTKEQTAKLTIITLVFCLLMAVFLGAVDYGFNAGFRALIDLLKA